MILNVKKIGKEMEDPNEKKDDLPMDCVDLRIDDGFSEFDTVFAFGRSCFLGSVYPI